jgi:DNA-binding MarR family transcriptional regulator
MIRALLAEASDAARTRIHTGLIAAGFTDLSPAQEVVFALLSPQGERIVDLARRAHITKQAMGYLVAALEAGGYLERLPDPHDGRAQLIRRTERGWAVNRTARQLVAELQEEWAAVLGPDRMQTLLELLRELLRALNRHYQSPEPTMPIASTGKNASGRTSSGKEGLD